MARSVNKVILIGNLTRDPELKYTPQGHAVCTFGIATNREWVTNGEKQEAADFHNIVAWNKLGEICSQFLTKGAKTYVEGRLQTRTWQGEDGKKNYKTEIVIDEMVILSGKGGEGVGASAKENTGAGEDSQLNDVTFGEEVSAEEIPF
ncbi:single-stranded DNA-binding protein [candidate division WWE3 bacterium]|nr:single-stranded DNA-binding protein [candidate division WWE3 bacterium]